LLTTGQTPAFSDTEATFHSLIASRFDPREAVYLPIKARSFVRATNSAKPEIVTARFAAHRIQLQVQTDAPGMIVIAQSYYHPWHAYVSDERVPLWRANYAFQALEVPAGQHKVELVYEDRRFHWGTLISGLAGSICVAAWYRRRRIKHPTRFEILPSR
jgi:uncharacterized membrane protein YfhO